MRKAILLTAAAAFLAVPVVVEAQDATVRASATIDGFAAFEQAYDETLSFGSLAATASLEDRTISTDNGGLKFNVSYNTAFEFTFPDGKLNLLENGGESIGFDLFCEWVAGADPSASGSADCEPGEVVAPTGGAGRGALFIGGRLHDLGDAPAGTYSGHMTIGIHFDS